MSQYPSYPPSYHPAYPGGPAQHDWQRLYGYPGGTPRPGILTAVGVISIVVAGLSVLGSGFSALQGIVLFQASRMSTTMATSSSSAYNAPVQGMAASPSKVSASGVSDARASSAAGEPNRRGMSKPDRAIAVAALDGIEQMTDGQKRQLDAILGRAGADFFPHDEAIGNDSALLKLSSGDIASAIKAHGTMPTADKEDDPVYFNTAVGHLELHDDRAIFRFTDPSKPAVRTSADAEEAAAAAAAPPIVPAPLPAPAVPTPEDPFAPPAATDPFANPDTQPATMPARTGGLTPAQIAMVVQRAQAASGGKMNPAQLATLTATLAKPEQTLVTPGTLWSPVSIAMIQPDGSVLLKMNGTYLMIDPQGTVSDRASGVMPKIVFNPMPIALVTAESVASLALAGYLLLCGILLLKQSPRGRRLHQVFALIKIPLAIIAVAGFCWMMADLTSNLRRIPGTAAPSDGFVTFGTVLAAAGIIYPVILLITMHTTAVRDYYRTMTGANDA